MGTIERSNQKFAVEAEPNESPQAPFRDFLAVWGLYNCNPDSPVELCYPLVPI
jgi:hypothetical protein